MNPHTQALTLFGPVLAASVVTCGGGAVGDTQRVDTQAAQDVAPHGAAVVASWDGGRIARSDLEAHVADELRRMDIAYQVERHDLLHRTLDGVLDDQVLEKAAADRGYRSVSAMLEAEVDAKLPEPSEEALRERFESFRQKVPSANNFELARPYLARELKASSRQAHLDAFVDQLRDEMGVKVSLPFPDIPRVDVDISPWNPVVGPDDAAVTIVEFGGYQCYYCQRFHDTVQEVLERYPDDVRLVFKDFPLAGHEHAHGAAQAAHCADQQGRWMEMASLLLAHQDSLDHAHLRGFADRLGLEPDAWQACMDDPVWSTRIERDVHLGREAGVTSTPTFFVNGLMVVGAMDRRRFLSMVEREIAAAKR